MNLTRQKPHDKELEQVVLGTVMLETTAFFRVSQILKEKTFYSKKHQIIYRAILALDYNQKPIDMVSIFQWLVSKGLSEKTGGPAYLSEMMNKVCSTAHLEYHASILHGYFVRRQLIEVTEAINKGAYDMSQDIMSLLEKTRSDLFSKTTMAVSRVRTAGHHAEQIVAKAKDMDGKFIEVRGVPTGFQALDKSISGLIGGRLYIIGGRPSMGKTTFTINMVCNAVKKFGKKVLFFSGEMSGEEITSIVMAKESNLPIKDVQSGMISDWRTVLDHFDQRLSDNLLIDDTPAPSLMHVQAESIKKVEQCGIDCIVIDYLQLMKVNEKGIDPGAAVSKISGALKELARRLDVPVIALSQLSRGCESRLNKRPVLSDLKQSGDVEQDADFVAFLYRPEYYGDTDKKGNNLTGIAEVIVRKNRQGPLDTYYMFMDKPIGRFYALQDKSDIKIPLEHYDMSITKPRLITDVLSIYATDIEPGVDDMGDDLPF